MAVDFSLLTSVIDFGTVVPAVLGVFGALVVVYVARVGAFMVVRAVGGGRTFYGGRFWDVDVYDDAMSRLEAYRKSGGRLDKDSRQHLTEWKSNRARSRL